MSKLKLGKKYSCFSVLIAISFLLGTAMPASAQTENSPDYVYLTYASPDPAHTINVSWRTDENYIGEVRYEIGSQNGAPEAYSSSMEGTGGVTTSEFEGYIHHVELTGLESDTIYYFICGNPDYGWSEELSFRTAPVERENIRFVVGGDSRGPYSGETRPYHWPEARDKITQLAASYNPDFIIFNGDFLSNGQEQPWPDTWDNWLGTWYKYARAEDGRLIPMVPVIGNHELPYPQPTDYDPMVHASNYYMLFNLPRDERWYSLNWGPDLHIVVLDSEIKSTTSISWALQLEWLEQDLAEHQDCLWKIVNFHRPVYSGGHHGGELHYLEDWVFLLDMYKVDVVFASHDHGYERTGAIDHTSHPEELMDSPKNGRIYVVTAGWGAPLYTGENSWFTAPDSPGRLGQVENFYHCCVIDVKTDETFHLRAVSHEGEVVDDYSFQKVVDEGALPTAAILAAAVVVVAIVIVGAFLLRRK